MTEDRVPLFVRLPRDQAVALDRLVDSTGRRKQHLVSELLADQLAVGHIEIAANAGDEDVLTLEEAAALLRLPVQVVCARAQVGDLPGRAFGEEWRFSRPALLAWLAAGEATPTPREFAGQRDKPAREGKEAAQASEPTANKRGAAARKRNG